MTDAIPVKRRDATSLGEFAATDRAPMRFLQLPRGYIDGLKMEWLSATSLRITTGAAYIPILDQVLDVPSAITKSSISLSASAWHHLYLFSNAGVPDFEVSATAPAAPYSGSARTKTGDTSRRYVGSVKTDASSQIIKFLQAGNSVLYQANTALAPLRILSNGLATTTTVVSAAGAIPVTSKKMTARLVSLSATPSNNLFVANPFAFPVVSDPNFIIAIGNNVNVYVPIATDDSQNINYVYGVGPGATGAYVEVNGYEYER
jgi:hypothetical protein